MDVFTSQALEMITSNKARDAFAADLKAQLALTGPHVTIPFVFAGVGLYRASFDVGGEPVPAFYGARMNSRSLMTGSTFTEEGIPSNPSGQSAASLQPVDSGGPTADYAVGSGCASLAQTPAAGFCHRPSLEALLPRSRQRLIIGRLRLDRLR